MQCENCDLTHDGSYGSGRFCSNKCARCFSTKARRLEINTQVSKKLTKPAITKQCDVCQANFETKLSKQICCSKICSEKRRGQLTAKKFENLIEERRKNGVGTGNYAKNPQTLLDLSPRTKKKILQRLNIGCSRCGWNEAPCDLHHIDGRKIINPDHHSNLTHICPNCHRLFHTGKIGRSDVQTLEQQVGEKWKDFYFNTRL